MKLMIEERCARLAVLPQEGDITTLRIIRDLRNELSWTEDETKKVNLRQEGASILWDKNADEGKDIDIGAKAAELILKGFQQVSMAKTMPLAYLAVYEKFAPKEGGKCELT